MQRRRYAGLGILALLVSGLVGTVGGPSAAVRATYTSTTAVPIPDSYSGNGPGITINAVGPATPYPATITVPTPVSAAGEPSGTVAAVRVRFNLTHSSPDDLDLILRGPAGQEVILMSDVGGTTPVTGIDLDFRSGAPALPDAGPLVDGSYAPTDYTDAPADNWPAPASPTTNTSLSVFNGATPYGAWQVLAVDDTGANAGSISGLRLEVDVISPVYTSTIQVSGALPSLADVNVTLNGLTHDYPADMRVLLQAPSGQQVILLDGQGGGEPVTNLNVTFDSDATVEAPAEGPLGAGPYAPANSWTQLPPPAPQRARLSDLNGINPNGVWKLYVFDAEYGDYGSLAGWSLSIDAVDPAAPTGTVTIDGGDALTNSATVRLTLSATDPAPASGVTQMRFSNDGTTWSAWQPYATSASWTLSSGDGVKRVYAQYIDAGGNLSAVVSDTIKLDTKSPRAKKLSPKNKATGVRRTVVLKVFANEKLNKRTITGKRVFLKMAGSKSKIKGKVRYLPGKKLITFTPAKPLAGGKFLLTVTPKVKDLAGNGFDGNKRKKGTQKLVVKFTTR